MDLCENGLQALEAYKNDHYDLIFMDCHMPEMDGYDVTREIRRLEEISGRHTLIIATTADAMPETRDKCLAAGMDDYISKPIDVDALRLLLRRWVKVSD
jgi:two-component system sensor histidine kinase EvgS